MNAANLSPHTAIETGIELFLASLSEAGPYDRAPLLPGTRRAYGIDLDQFARFLHTRVAAPTVANVPAEAVAAFARQLTDAGRSPRTVDRKLAAVRRLFRFLRARGVCPADPSAGVRGPGASGEPDPPTPEEMGAILSLPERGSFTGARNRALLELLYGAGLRLSEAVSLNLSHLHLTDGRLRITGASPRALPLGPQATEALEAYLLLRAEALLQRSISSVDAGASSSAPAGAACTRARCSASSSVTCGTWGRRKPRRERRRRAAGAPASCAPPAPGTCWRRAPTPGSSPPCSTAGRLLPPRTVAATWPT